MLVVPTFWASLVSQMVKNLPAVLAGDQGSIPGSGRSPGEGINNLLQYSCLENPMDKGAWWAAIYGVAKSWTQLKQLIMQERWEEIGKSKLESF